MRDQNFSSLYSRFISRCLGGVKLICSSMNKKMLRKSKYFVSNMVATPDLIFFFNNKKYKS